MGGENAAPLCSVRLCLRGTNHRTLAGEGNQVVTQLWPMTCSKRVGNCSTCSDAAISDSMWQHFGGITASTSVFRMVLMISCPSGVLSVHCTSGLIWSYVQCMDRVKYPKMGELRFEFSMQAKCICTVWLQKLLPAMNVRAHLHKMCPFAGSSSSYYYISIHSTMPSEHIWNVFRRMHFGLQFLLSA